MITALFASVVAAQETPFILFGCALFAAALFVYVFYQPGEVEVGEAKTRYGYLQERKDATYENLRDLNFEYKAGKLSEEDYAMQQRLAGRRSGSDPGRDGSDREDAVAQALGEGRAGMKTPASPLRGSIFAISTALVGLALLCTASAQNITGTVTNGTTGKPAAGDEVTLLSLSQGMQEVGSTKTDAQGKFSMAAPADQGVPHMVRVTHGGVNYFPQGGPLMPGATTAEVTVYDTAKKLDGISQTVEVDRFQTDGSQLQGIALFAIKNGSTPPRALDGDKTFEFVLPAGAEIDSGMAKSPGGQPLNTMPSETDKKGHYAFSFPLRPGETQFQVSYHMPYSGEASFSPKPLAEVQHFVVMTPKGMTFAAKDPQRFQSMPDNSGAGIMVATNAKPGEDLSFKITGSGQFQAEGQQAAAAVTMAVAAEEPWAAANRQAVTIVPAADWARRSTPTIRCTIIAP